jgi:hypothetical protein
MDDVAQQLQHRLAKLQADRMNFDTMWDKIARVVLPSAIGFTTSFAPGSNLNTDVYDATAQLALPRFAAAIDTLVTPQTTKWHNLQPKNKALKASVDVQRFLSTLNDRLFAVRYSPRANFASRVSEVYTSMGAFGNGVLYIHDAKPGIKYISIHLSEIWFDEDSTGRVTTAFWVHEYSVRNFFERFPDADVPKLRQRALADPKVLDEKIKVCKAVYPRENRDVRKMDAKNMRFASVTFTMKGNGGHGGSQGMTNSAAINTGDEPEIIENSGYRTFPFAVARYVTAPREIYARGPANDAYPDIKTLQEMSKTVLRTGQLAADPMYLAMDADAIDPFVARPGSVNYGYLSPDGNARIKPVELRLESGFTLELMQQRREAVNGAFLINLFQVLIDKGSDRKTATEVMQLVQEKGALLGPVGSRLRTEFLGTIIEREIDILFNSNVFSIDDVPEELRGAPELDVEYDSPLTRTMKAEEGLGILRTYDFAAQLINAGMTSVAKKLNGNRALERIADVNGAPPDVLFSDEEVKAQAEQESAGNAAGAMVGAMPGIAAAAKDFAKAQQLSRGAPQAGNSSAVI